MNNGAVAILIKSFIRHVTTTRFCFYGKNSNNIKLTTKKQVNVPIMSKMKLQRVEMQRQRKKIKKRTERYIPSCVSLQILGCGSRSTPRSLYVSTDHTKYLFNCGEGTQRLAYEHRLRLSKLEHVFLTTATWENLGGLPGIALTVQDSGVPNVKIHGPKGTSDLFRAVERFVVLNDLTVSEAECDENEVFVDQTMTVRYVKLTKTGTDSTSESEGEVENDNKPVELDDVNYYDYTANENGKRASQTETQKRKIKKLEEIVDSNKIRGSMAYICKLHPKPGPLLLDKCVDKGVPPGPLLGKLKAGEDVTLPDGTVVLSIDVCSPTDPEPVFIVLECPDEDYLDSLTNCEAFRNYQSDGSDKSSVANCVVHFTHENIINNSRYRDWMNKFPAKTQHIIINEENNCSGSEAIHRIQHKLHLLNSNIFPFLDESGLTIDPRSSKELKILPDDDCLPKKDENTATNIEKMEESKDIDIPVIHRVKTLDAMHLRPSKGFDTSAEIVLRPRDYIDETFAVDGFLDALAELQTETNAFTKLNEEKKSLAEYPKIVMLGTGSCIPSKTRNTSAILLRIDESRSMLLDCGEGTAGQLVRFYGKERVDKILETIKAIYISHLHADHHIGLIGVLKERARVTQNPIVLFAPERISTWLYLYNKKFERIADTYNLISNKDIYYKIRNVSANKEMQIQQALGSNIDVGTVLVKHCPHAFGVAITLDTGCKIVYSGDTMPCDALVELGEDCDLLIHEATMEDELIDEAKTKYHSTISQAIDIGERMKAKFSLLTHFSQRYSKIPHLPNNVTGLERVGIAYDNMEVPLSQLKLLPLMYPCLKLMFSEFCILLEEKAFKRQMRVERDARMLEEQREFQQKADSDEKVGEEI